MPNRWIVLFFFLVLCNGIGALGGLFVAPALADWYPSLVKPWFNPPTWIFAPVWTLLYILMAIAAWLVWQTGERRALPVFFMQLALNLFWSYAFFGLKSIGLALIVIVFLWFAIAVCIYRFSFRSRLAAWLMAPYLAWVSFAGLLNAAIWWLNRGP